MTMFGRQEIKFASQYLSIMTLHVDNKLHKSLITRLNGLFVEIERKVTEPRKEIDAERVKEVVGKVLEGGRFLNFFLL